MDPMKSKQSTQSRTPRHVAPTTMKKELARKKNDAESLEVKLLSLYNGLIFSSFASKILSTHRARYIHQQMSLGRMWKAANNHTISLIRALLAELLPLFRLRLARLAGRSIRSVRILRLGAEELILCLPVSLLIPPKSMKRDA